MEREVYSAIYISSPKRRLSSLTKSKVKELPQANTRYISSIVYRGLCVFLRDKKSHYKVRWEHKVN